jgi:hypothetical protein
VDVSPKDGPSKAAPCRWINKTFKGLPIVERIGTKEYVGGDVALAPFMSGRDVYLKEKE